MKSYKMYKKNLFSITTFGHVDMAAKEAIFNNKIPKIDLSFLENTAEIGLKRSKRAHQILRDRELSNKLYQIKQLLAPNMILLFCPRQYG